MNSDSRLLSNEEREDIIKDIMAQNEVILDQHRKKLELEFQEQLKGMLTGMTTGDDDDEEEEEDREEVATSHTRITPASAVVDSSTANLANEQFFHAAQDTHSKPQIHIYEGNQHTATVRASQETTAMGQDSKPAVVSSSKSKVVNSDNGPKKIAAPKSPTPAKLQIYNQPFLHKSKSTVKKDAANKQKRLQDKQRNAEIDEKIRSQQLINRVSSPDGYGKSAEVDALMYRVSGGTKTALMKSSSLVEEMTKQNKNILKKYPQQQPRRLSTGDCDDNGYADFIDHSNSSPKSKTLPHQQKHPSSGQKGKGKGGKQHQQQSKNNKNDSSSKGDNNAGFLPPVQTSTPRTPRQDEFGDTQGTTMDGGLSSTAQEEKQEPMYVMQQGDATGDDTTLSGESVDPTSGGVFQDKRTWENQLARHILSVYASAQKEDVKKSRAVLEFVDLKNKTTSEDLVQEGLFDRSLLDEQKHKVMDATLRKPKEGKTGTKGTGTISGAGAGAGAGDTMGATEKKKLKKKNKKKQLKFREDEVDPVATVGQDRLVATMTLDRKERDDINPLLATEENKITRVGLVRAPPKCFPIWFVSSGDMYAEWLSLPDGDQLQPYLDSIMEKGKYRTYLETVEGLLETHWISAYYRQAESKKKPNTLDCGQKKKKVRAVTPPRRRRMDLTEIVHDEEPPLTTDELKVLYRQLLLVANAFAINCIEKKDFDSAMLIIRMAEGWVGREELFAAESRCELKAFINQTLSYYFYRTKKAGAALNHTKLALAAFSKIGTESDNATSLLHLACCHYQVGKFKAAHETIYKFLGMVEEGRIAFNETEPKELCLVAIAYHNLAVVQLKLQVPDVAAKSSQNARKIARLCLSYSNRWINTFHWTHQLCLADVKYELENNFKLTEDQVSAMNDLMKILYDPFPS